MVRVDRSRRRRVPDHRALCASATLISGDVIVDGEPLLDELPRSSKADFAASLRRLDELPADTILAGHGPIFGRSRAHEIIAEYLTSRGL